MRHKSIVNEVFSGRRLFTQTLRFLGGWSIWNFWFEQFIQLVPLLSIARATQDSEVFDTDRASLGKGNHVVKLQLIIGDVLVTSLAHLPITSYHL